MQSVMSAGSVSARFDDENLIGYGGLVPVVRLAEWCELPALAAGLLKWKSSADSAGAFPVAKLLSLVFGVIAGADSIDDMHRLRHGAMGRAFTGTRAPSTLGSFLRALTHGHVQQLQAVLRRFVPVLAAHTPLLPGAGQIAHVDIDDTIRRTYAYAKQGAGIGYSKVKGLNALIGTVCTPLARPVIVAARLRRGAAGSTRGAATFAAQAIKTAKECGAAGLVVVRADSAFYNADVIGAARRLGACFSVTVRMNPSIRAAIAAIEETAWVSIRYPQAIWFTDTPLTLIEAEKAHRGHAIVEQVIADLKNSALAHLPSGVFNANAAGC